LYEEGQEEYSILNVIVSAEKLVIRIQQKQEVDY